MKTEQHREISIQKHRYQHRKLENWPKSPQIGSMVHWWWLESIWWDDGLWWFAKSICSSSDPLCPDHVVQMNPQYGLSYEQLVRGLPRSKLEVGSCNSWFVTRMSQLESSLNNLVYYILLQCILVNIFCCKTFHSKYVTYISWQLFYLWQLS